MTTTWESKFAAVLGASAKKAGMSLDGLKWERCTTDATWGDRCGLVFFGASPEINKRAAKFFEAWAALNLRKAGIVGDYNAQESIRFEGLFHYLAYNNGARGWYRGADLESLKVGDVKYTLSNGFDLALTEKRDGFATSYVYYPCGD